MKESNTRVFELPDGRRLEVLLEDLVDIFKGLRPRLMSYEDFKFIGKILNKENKKYLKGKLVHVSKVTDTVWKDYTGGKKIKQKGNTYVRDN